MNLFLQLDYFLLLYMQLCSWIGWFPSCTVTQHWITISAVAETENKSTGFCFVFALFLFCMIFLPPRQMIHPHVLCSDAPLHALVHTPCVAWRPAAAFTCCLWTSRHSWGDLAKVCILKPIYFKGHILSSPCNSAFTGFGHTTQNMSPWRKQQVSDCQEVKSRQL